MAAKTRLTHRLAQRRENGERGTSTVETVVIYPVILLLIFTMVQAGLWYHSREVALHAANAASVAASAENASDGQGQAAATAFVNRAGALREAGVSVSRGAETVTATVTGRSPSLIPGMQLPLITQSSTSAIERYVP